MIKLNNVVKQFNSKNILNGVSFHVNPGEIFLIIGRSGAGKTVLLKTILGLLIPESGNIYIDGVNSTALPKKELEKLRLQFGLVFQGSALFDFLTVEENVSFYFHQHTNLKRDVIRSRVAKILALVGLEGIEDKYPYELSGGMKKRVAIARAIIYEPKVLIYDEPTTGIDPIALDMIANLIKDLNKTLNITSLVVTHDLTVGLKLADRLAFLLGGKIVFEGNKEELKESCDLRVKQFMEGSSMGPISEMEV